MSPNNDPADLLPPTPEPLPTGGRRPKLVCEFCECQLAPSGDVLATSDRAKTFRDLHDKHDALKIDHAKVVRERDDAIAKLRELDAKKKSSSLFGE